MNSGFDPDASYREPGLGWIFFAGTMLGLTGVMRIFDALWAFRYDGVIPDNLEGALLGTSLTSYAWLWLITGAVLIYASVALLMRSQIARWIGIIASAFMIITAFWWIPYYPVWSFVYVLNGVLVIYCLTAYGGRDRADN